MLLMLSFVNPSKLICTPNTYVARIIAPPNTTLAIFLLQS